MANIVLRVRRVYFDQIVKGEKKVELRAGKRFWNVRLQNVLISNEIICATFISGKDVHRRIVERITREPKRRIPELLGREVSKQGYADLDLDRSDYVWAIWLGEEVAK